jgi:hypothetical protein
VRSESGPVAPAPAALRRSTRFEGRSSTCPTIHNNSSRMEKFSAAAGHGLVTAGHLLAGSCTKYAAGGVPKLLPDIETGKGAGTRCGAGSRRQDARPGSRRPSARQPQCSLSTRRRAGRA